MSANPTLETSPMPRLRGIGAWRPSPAYLWIAPAVGLVLAIIAYPVAKAIEYSLTSRTTFQPGEFIGIDNYQTLLSSDLFWLSLKNNAILLLSVPLTIVVGLLITGILARGLRGSRLYEALIFIPFLPAVASISVIFLYVFAIDGPLNEALTGIGLDGFEEKAWLAESSTAIWAVFFVLSWKRLGFTVLLLTARMASLDRAHFEAAAIDGASWFRTFWRVAVPQMKSAILFLVVLGILEVMSFTFAYVFVLTRGGPGEATYTLEYLLYRYQFSDQLVGLASALAVFLLLVAIAVAVYRAHLAREDVLSA